MNATALLSRCRATCVALVCLVALGSAAARGGEGSATDRELEQRRALIRQWVEDEATCRLILREMRDSPAARKVLEKELKKIVREELGRLR